MAIESKRGCGYRKVGGLYLVGDYVSVYCDRLPYKLEVCPICGAGIKVGRGMSKINPLKLFGEHFLSHIEVYGEDDAEEVLEPCEDNPNCYLCQPKDETAYLMGVGERFYPTPKDFLDEGILQGFSKRIAQIPKEFEIGKTIIYLSHPKACQEAPVNGGNGKLVEVEYTAGIFTAFIPQRIEKLYWQSEIDNMSDKEKKSLGRRGITPVGIPNGDNDHR